jgi:hypothetical protein
MRRAMFLLLPAFSPSSHSRYRACSFAYCTDQPLAALGVEVDLDPGVAAAPLEVEHHALAEHLVIYALPEAQPRIGAAGALANGR